MNRLLKLRKNEKGQSLVEFALILPILLLIIMGIVQFGLVFLGYISVSNAAREGARVGIVQSNYNDARDKAIERANEVFEITPALIKPGVPTTIKEVASDWGSGKPFTVTVNGDVKIIVPLLDSIFTGGTISVKGESSMRIEGYDENE